MKTYAYGDWCVDGIDCPVGASGLGDGEFAAEVAEEYDETAMAMGYAGEGVLSEDEAKEVWKELLLTIKGLDTGISEEEYDQAVDVANELGWGDIVREVS